MAVVLFSHLVVFFSLQVSFVVYSVLQTIKKQLQNRSFVLLRISLKSYTLVSLLTWRVGDVEISWAGALLTNGTSVPWSRCLAESNIFLFFCDDFSQTFSCLAYELKCSIRMSMEFQSWHYIRQRKIHTKASTANFRQQMLHGNRKSAPSLRPMKTTKNNNRLMPRSNIPATLWGVYKCKQDVCHWPTTTSKSQSWSSGRSKTENDNTTYYNCQHHLGISSTYHNFHVITTNLLVPIQWP